jgi:nitroreductase
MNTLDSINARRSIKTFTDRPVSREEIEQLLSAACQAPNHRMTEPWRFYVLGPRARRAYGEALGRRKAKRVDDPVAGKAVIEKVAKTHESLPAMVAVAIKVHEDPEIREEDFAAGYMGIQNLSLVAHSMGLGTHIKTGAIMDDPAARAAVKLPEGEKIVATINIGEPDGLPDGQARQPATELTTWVE